MACSSLDRYRSDDVPVSGIRRTIDDWHIMAELAPQVQYERSIAARPEPDRNVPLRSAWTTSGGVIAHRQVVCERGAPRHPGAAACGARVRPPAGDRVVGPSARSSWAAAASASRSGGCSTVSHASQLASSRSARASAPMSEVSGRTTTNRPGPSPTTASSSRVRSRSNPPMTGPSRATAPAASAPASRAVRTTPRRLVADVGGAGGGPAASGVGRSRDGRRIQGRRRGGQVEERARGPGGRVGRRSRAGRPSADPGRPRSGWDVPSRPGGGPPDLGPRPLEGARRGGRVAGPVGRPVVGCRLGPGPASYRPLRALLPTVGAAGGPPARKMPSDRPRKALIASASGSWASSRDPAGVTTRLGSATPAASTGRDRARGLRPLG